MILFCGTSIAENTVNSKIPVDSEDLTNDFYDNAETFELVGEYKILVTGETDKDYKIDIRDLPLREIIVKESVLKGSSTEFIGAYKYWGYSLYDILNKVTVKKKNFDDFPRVVDQYVVVANDKGESAAVSWGEIYYPNQRQYIIIATMVTRIVPTSTGELWDLPKHTKLVVGPDLVSERNIANPNKIIVKSFAGDFPGEKGYTPLFSKDIKLSFDGNEIATIYEVPDGLVPLEYPTIFYGRGTGIHGITTFEGYLFKEFLESYFTFSKENIKNGVFALSAKDAYRCVYTYSEIFNRNDQSEFLVLDMGKDEFDGKFKVFPGPDFFSDRAIKSVAEIRYIIERE